MYEVNFTGYMLYSIALTSLFRNRFVDAFSIWAFVVFCACFQMLDERFGANWGFTYYFGAAVCDLAIISVLYRVKNPTATLVRIQTLCLWFMYANAAGCAMYELGFEPDIYNIITRALFVLVLLVSIANGKGDDLGNATIRWNGFSFYRSYTASPIQMQTNKEKIS